MALTAAILEPLVAEWRRLRPSKPNSAALLSIRLPAFVDAWRIIAPSRSTAREVSPSRSWLTIEMLAPIVEQLRSALAEARSSGAFFDTWRMGGLGRRELANASALRQLLDPRGDHGLGVMPLEGLFDALVEAASNCPRPTDLRRATAQVECRPLQSERDRVDLVIDHPELLLFIEIKIDAIEGRDQLDRYAQTAEQLAHFTGRPAWRVVFLTPRALRITTPDVISLRWHALATALRRRLSDTLTGSDARTPIFHLLTHFSNL